MKKNLYQDDIEWQREAACRSADPELFFPPDGERKGTGKSREDEAKAFCRQCKVAAECLEFAIKNKEPGIWGGLNDDEREGLGRRAIRESIQRRIS